MTPDPDFYFEGRGHSRTFAYVRYAVLEGESFVVLTGETGIGKTTVVHKLLKAVESQAIVFALLGGTQLDAAQLLAAVLTAFRANVAGDSLEELRAGLQAFLTTVTASGRRALIVVDEAQHLLPDAVQELTALSTMQSRRGSPLQVLLVGQPELRTKLGSMPTDALRGPVFLSCDLGRLSPSETRSYIEHRLRHVEWEQSPLFSNEAHERIFAATDGVPRRINRLCDRLLTAAFQQQLDEVSAELVEEVDDELRSEVGDLATFEADAAEAAPQLQDASGQSPTPADSDIPAQSPIDTGGAPAVDRSQEAASDAIEPTAEANPGRPTLAVRRALVGAVALVFASLVFWGAYEYESFARDQPLSTLAEATRTGSGKVSSQGGRAAAADPQALGSKQSVVVRAPESGSPASGSMPRNSTPASAIATPPRPTAGSLDVPVAAAAPIDVARVAQESPKGDADSPGAARAQSVVKPARTRASRRNVVPASSAPEQAGPSEPRLQAAQPRPVPAPCNAAVVALGLCTP